MNEKHRNRAANIVRDKKRMVLPEDRELEALRQREASLPRWRHPLQSTHPTPDRLRAASIGDAFSSGVLHQRVEK